MEQDIKIPKYVIDNLKKAAKYSTMANECMRVAEDYLEKHFPHIDLRSGNGCSLEEFELGNDVTKEFLEWLTRQEAEKALESEGE